MTYRLQPSNLLAYECDDRVKFVRLGGDKMEGKKGTVIGVAIDVALARHYIVLLDEPVTQERLEDFGLVRAISITEHCLERLPNE